MGMFDSFNPVAAIGSIAGGLIARKDAEKAANSANDFNSNEAVKNRAYQTDMSNTSYQRSMDDMRKAGLNPMLAYSQGGASTPGGSSASGVAAQTQPMDPGEAIRSGITSSLEVKRLKKDVEQADSQVKLNAAAEKTAQTQQKLNQSSARKVDADAKLSEATLPAVQQDTRTRVKHGKLDEENAIWDNWGRRLGETVGTISNAAGALKPGFTINTKSTPSKSNPSSKNIAW
jgi:hypothetical protein